MFDINNFCLQIANLETTVFSAENLQLSQAEVENIADELVSKNFFDLNEESTQEFMMKIVAEMRGEVLPETADKEIIETVDEMSQETVDEVVAELDTTADVGAEKELDEEVAQ